jgi:tRNA(Ile2) C34 agmatinyltransferase TiaS
MNVKLWCVTIMKKVTITLNDDVWRWWKKNPWINLSQLAERELVRIRMLEERDLGTCPECGNAKLKFDGKIYRCSKCGYVYR